MSHRNQVCQVGKTQKLSFKNQPLGKMLWMMWMEALVMVYSVVVAVITSVTQVEQYFFLGLFPVQESRLIRVASDLFYS